MKPSSSQSFDAGQYDVPSEASADLHEAVKFFPQGRILRTLGSLLQQAGFVDFELTVDDTVYCVQGQVAQNTAATESLLKKLLALGNAGKRRLTPVKQQVRYSLTELLSCETQERDQRKQPSQMTEPYSTAQILRGVGGYLDKRKGSRLRSVSVKDRWVTIHYVTADGREQKESQDFEYFYNFWIKMYLQRGDRNQLAKPSDPTLYVTWESGRRQHTLSRVST